MVKSASTDSRSPAWRRRKEHREPELLAAARALLEERGLSGMSMAEIGARAGVSEATVYKYFPNRRELMARVMSDWMSPVLQRMERDTDLIEGTCARLQLLALIHFRDMAENPGLHQLIYRELHWEDYYGSPVHRLNQRYTRLVDGIITDGQRLGDVRSDIDVAFARDMLFGAFQHIGERTLLNGRPLNLERASKAVAEQLFGGIGVSTVQPVDALVEVTERLERVVAAIQAKTGEC